MIYLDNNATTPVDPEVYDTVLSSLKRDIGNPSSVHLAGRKAKDVIENARASVADLLPCSPEEIYFTSGGTESNNLALIGTVLLHRRGHIITSSIEHPSVLQACRHLESRGFDVTYVPAGGNGAISPDAVRQSIRDDTVLISIMHSNNETGVVQPVKEIGAISKHHGIIFHVDAAQSVGKMFFQLTECSIDLLTLVSHKFYGPKGIGALYIKKDVALQPILFGAGHERGLRPGTENVAGIAGLGKACQLAKRDIKLRVAHTGQLTEMFLHGMMAAVTGVVLNGQEAHRLPNTLNLRIPGIKSYDLVDKIKDRIAISAGSACHAGCHTPSHVLKTMGLSDDEAFSSVRISVGKDNTEEEIRKAIEIIALAVEELRKAPSS